jgi:hypothetical protein
LIFKNQEAPTSLDGIILDSRIMAHLPDKLTKNNMESDSTFDEEDFYLESHKKKTKSDFD